MPARGASGGGDSIFAASAFNVGARSWEAMVNLATVPVLLAHQGAEAYGLIGFTQSIFGLLGLLDFGLPNAVNRELARHQVAADGLRPVRAIVRSLELPLLAVAFVLAGGLLAASGFVASDYLRVESLPPGTVTLVLQVFAGIFVCRWVAGFYRGIFFGLERQVRYNVYSVLYTTLRFLGGAGLLVSGVVGIVGLFVWYAATDALFFAALRLQVLKYERAGSVAGPAFSSARLRAVLPYALGTMGLALVGVLVMQVDKLLIARLRPLSELGAYTFAFTLAMGIRIIPGAIWTATFPRLVQVTQARQAAGIRAVLVAAFRFSSLSALALAAPLAVFSPDIVATVGGRAAGIALAAPLLSLLAIGVFVESLVSPCYQQLLADGHARVLLRLALEINLVFVVAVAIAIVALGVVGAALCWPALQIGSWWLYARRARAAGGPDFSGTAQAAAPYFLAVLAATALARVLSLGASPLVGTALAATVGLVAHLLIGWRMKQQRDAEPGAPLA